LNASQYHPLSSVSVMVIVYVVLAAVAETVPASNRTVVGLPPELL
jgi:hypothetical protein